MLVIFIGGQVGKFNVLIMLVGFSKFPHGFDLLEGNIHDQDKPPSTKLEMLNANGRPFIQAKHH